MSMLGSGEPSEDLAEKLNSLNMNDKREVATFIQHEQQRGSMQDSMFPTLPHPLRNQSITGITSV